MGVQEESYMKPINITKGNHRVPFDVLGFDPFSQEPTSFIMEITPDMAAYILKYHNNDNRKLIKSQVNKIVASIRKDGWIFDGQPITFNVEGNLTEGQHRLHAIVITGVTAKCSISCGIVTGAFTKCTPAKPRKAEDEIQRKDKTATSSEASTLRQVLIRRKGEKLTIQNAIEKWVFWKQFVRTGTKSIDTFFDQIDKFNAWKRTFGAWATLMATLKKEKVATDFLSLLESEIKDDTSPCCLTREFVQFFEKESVYMSNAGRTELVFQLLCVASDRMIKEPSGDIQLNVSMDKMNHEMLRKRGTYRSFLDNPDNIILAGKLP